MEGRTSGICNVRFLTPCETKAISTNEASRPVRSGVSSQVGPGLLASILFASSNPMNHPRIPLDIARGD